MIDWSQPQPLSKVTEDAGFTMSDVAFVASLDESTVSRLWDDPRDPAKSYSCSLKQL
jgi:hypothetical protein